MEAEGYQLRFLEKRLSEKIMSCLIEGDNMKVKFEERVANQTELDLLFL